MLLKLAGTLEDNALKQPYRGAWGQNEVCSMVQSSLQFRMLHSTARLQVAQPQGTVPKETGNSGDSGKIQAVFLSWVNTWAYPLAICTISFSLISEGAYL